jgi:hypothetical protein
VRPKSDYNATTSFRQAKTQPRRFQAAKCAKTAIPFGEQRILGIWKHERGVLVLRWRSEARGYPRDFGGEEREDMVTLRMK